MIYLEQIEQEFFLLNCIQRQQHLHIIAKTFTKKFWSICFYSTFDWPTLLI